MLKEHSTIVRRLVIFGDLALLAAAFFLAFRLRFGRLPADAGELGRYGWVVLLFSLVFLFNLYRAGFYHKLRYLSYRRLGERLLVSFLTAVALAAAALFFSHATHYSRLLFGYFAALTAAFTLLTKLGGKLLLNRLRARGLNFRSLLLAGRGAKLARLEEIFKPGNPYGCRIAATIDLDRTSPSDFARLLTRQVIDEIYFALPRRTGKTGIDPYLEQAEAAGKTCKILLNINENRLSKCEFSRLEELPLVVLYPVTLDPDQLLLKRLLDLLGAGVGLTLTLLLLPFIAAAIKLDSPGPVFFSQVRIGENGRRFRLHKFRSMYRDAEARKAELLAANELKGAVFKITDDPRITRVGRFLRGTSLDELPQFWNVLVGEMSLVGTRPPTPDEVEKYALHHYRRLSIKPGLTGLWQVSGRNRITDFDEIVKLDTRYIDQWSLWLDCRILLKTLTAIWQGK